MSSTRKQGGYKKTLIAKNSQDLSPSQLKKLQDVLAKFPLGKISDSHRNKISLSLSRDFDISPDVVQHWFKVNATKVPLAAVTTPRAVTEGKGSSNQKVQIIESEKKSVSLEESSLDPDHSISGDSSSTPQNLSNAEQLQSLKVKYDELLAEHKEKVAYCDTLKKKCHD